MSLFDDDKPNYSNSSFPPPRPFQITAHEKLRQGVVDGHRCQMLMAPTGAGKSYIGLRIAHEALQKNKRVLFVCDRTTLINQTSEVADSYGLSAHGVIQANHWRTDLRLPFQIASVQTLARRAWPDVDVIIVDECFVGDTLIETPDGEIRIDAINNGDNIHNSIGDAQVLSVFKKTVYKTILVRLSNGKSIECTAEHPFFTNKGWRPASTLARGERLFSRDDMSDLWGGVSPLHDKERAPGGFFRDRGEFQEACMLREILREEIEQPNAQAGSAGKNGTDITHDRALPEKKRRKRTADARGSVSVAVVVGVGMGAGICRADDEKLCSGVSASLQSGLGEQVINDGCRIGREQPFILQEAGAGCEENSASSQPRVESVEVIEHPSGINVYNIRVGGHPSYFANGVLVHNCHTMYSAWTKHVMESKARVIGLSATPFSAGLGKIFTNLVNAATMNELTDSGTLVPMRIYSCTKPDMTGAETAGGEWTDKAAAERGTEIIGDVVVEWTKYANGLKTIIFGATIAHCEEIARQFNAVGVMTSVFCSDTKPEERKVLLDEYKKHDSALRVLVSVEALAKGFDVKDVECIADCRPLRKSLSTAIQMWGRGLRSSPETNKKELILLDFSGNIVRFAADFSDIFYNGLATLDAGDKLDKTIRKDDEEEKEGKPCPSCGFMPFAKRCIACGYEYIKPALVEHEAGEMAEIFIGKKKYAENAYNLFEQCVTHSRSRGKTETISTRAAHLFKSITGDYPPRIWNSGSVKDVVVGRNVINMSKANLIKYRASTCK